MVIYHTWENTAISVIATCLKFDFDESWRVAFKMTKTKIIH